MSDSNRITLKVGKATNPALFAGAVYKNLEEGKVVEARAFGATANYTMSKGIAIAHEYFRSHGKELLCQVSTREETNAPGPSNEEWPIRSFTTVFFVLDGKNKLLLHG